MRYQRKNIEIAQAAKSSPLDSSEMCMMCCPFQLIILLMIEDQVLVSKNPLVCLSGYSQASSES